jgi:2-isopropylmalate synthase
MHFFNVISHLKKHVPNIDQCVLSTHCHNDLGLAVANSLAGVEAGARQIECTINGLGERAGNAALEEVVMALRTRGDYYRVGTNIHTTKLWHASRLVSKVTGVAVQRNKAIVGQNAFAHEAGIHQHGMLQSRATYEIMRPEDVGYVGENLVLGKHSGRHAFRDRVAKLGFQIDDETFQRVYDECITLADKKKSIYDADIVAIIESKTQHVPETWTMQSFHVFGGTGTIPTATVELHRTLGEGEGSSVVRDAATGDGPIDAVFRVLERITGVTASLTQYEVKSVSGGKDAHGEVSVAIEHDGKTYHGQGLSTDVIEASAKAYLQALNKAYAGTGGKPVAVEKGV